jgi:hypothetical protein
VRLNTTGASNNVKAVSTRWRRFLISLTVLGAVFCLVDAGLVAVRYTWTKAEIVPGGSGLGRVTIAKRGEHVASVSAYDSSGQAVPVTLRGRVIEPAAKLAVGERIHLVATVRRSKWVGWLLGKTEQVTAVDRTPASFLTETMVYPRAGRAVSVHFSSPVRVVSVQRAGGRPKQLTLRKARREASIGVTEGGANLAGTALVAGVPRMWEVLPAARRIAWFPPGPAPSVLVRPAPKSQISPSAPIVLRFSRPVDQVLQGGHPTLKPKVQGSWRQPNDYTLVFQPSGLGFPLGRRIHLRLPQSVQVISGSDPSRFRTLTWQVPRGSLLRMKQMLADLGYLPLAWQPAGHAVELTPAAQARAAVDPPGGQFVWRYPKTPAALKGLWTSDSDRPVLVRGAIMAFESTHGMATVGFPSMAVFHALLRDELAGRRAKSGYSYVYVTETLPETLTLWHNGKVILRSAVNTGIPGRETDIGTFPVYLHLTETTMSGTNPDGSHYNDPGVPWVNYFSGGDAVHGFVRGSYGWPQSLGCVEAPIDTAGQIFPYVNVGTLVTVSAGAAT